MDGSDETVHTALVRLQQKMEIFDAERAQAWASLRPSLFNDNEGGAERWPNIAASGARPHS